MTKHLTNIDLKQNQIKNAVIHNLSIAPENPKNGQIYYNTTDNKFQLYENGTWISYTTISELEENYYNKSQIDSMISSSGGLPDQTDNAGKVLTTDGTSPSWNHIINMNNVTESTNEGLSNLVINKLTQAEYDALVENGEINENELYMTTDDSIIPTKTSELTNDSGFITEIPAEYITETELESKGYLTEIPAEYVTETELESKGYLTEHQDISGKADVTYVDEQLVSKADKTELPTLTSQLTNDSGFITEIPAEYVTETELESEITSIKPTPSEITISSTTWTTTDNINSARINVSGLLSTDIVWVSPLTTADSSNESVYIDNNIRAITQEDDYLTFYCDTIPTEDVIIKLVIQHI